MKDDLTHICVGEANRPHAAGRQIVPDRCSSSWTLEVERPDCMESLPRGREITRKSIVILKKREGSFGLEACGRRFSSDKSLDERYIRVHFPKCKNCGWELRSKDLVCPECLHSTRLSTFPDTPGGDAA